MAQSAAVHIIQFISAWSIPILLLFIIVTAWIRGVKVYETFVAGAAQGLQTSVQIAPYFIAMWVALGLWRAAAISERFLARTRPFLQMIGLPPEVLPLVITRPLSGSGALAILSELLHTWGPDSPLGLLASLLQGSTETTFYVLTVYLGAVSIRRPRHSLYAALVGDLVGFLAAVTIWRLFYQIS